MLEPADRNTSRLPVTAVFEMTIEYSHTAGLGMFRHHMPSISNSLGDEAFGRELVLNVRRKVLHTSVLNEPSQIFDPVVLMPLQSCKIRGPKIELWFESDGRCARFCDTWYLRRQAAGLLSVPRASKMVTLTSKTDRFGLIALFTTKFAPDTTCLRL